MEYRYHSLEDFLASNMLTVDGSFDNGWGANLSVKGREIDATIMFCDIAKFSRRTLNLTPTETLIFANKFFTWMTAEAIAHSRCIIDKYIGDAFMVVFSREFGCEDPFAEAVCAGCDMYQHDVHNFCPNIGLASGKVIVGFVGTAVRYNCSVFGAAVSMAARCAAVRAEINDEFSAGQITFPAAEWGDRTISDVCPPRSITDPDGTVRPGKSTLRLRDPRCVKIKHMPDTMVRELECRRLNLSTFAPEDRAKQMAWDLQQHNRMWAGTVRQQKKQTPATGSVASVPWR